MTSIFRSISTRLLCVVWCKKKDDRKKHSIRPTKAVQLTWTSLIWDFIPDRPKRFTTQYCQCNPFHSFFDTSLGKRSLYLKWDLHGMELYHWSMNVYSLGFEMSMYRQLCEHHGVCRSRSYGEGCILKNIPYRHTIPVHSPKIIGTSLILAEHVQLSHGWYVATCIRHGWVNARGPLFGVGKLCWRPALLYSSESTVIST